MSVLDKLGWDRSKQDEIRHKVRNTREALLHTVARMLVRPSTGEYYIRIVDRVGLTPYVLAESKPIKSRDLQIKMYDRLIKELGLPWCCRVCKEEFEGPDESEAVDALFADPSDPDDLLDSMFGDEPDPEDALDALFSDPDEDEEEDIEFVFDTDDDWLEGFD